MITAITTAIEQQSSISDNSTVKQESLNLHDSVSSLEFLDDTEFELERIMFEEFAKGLPSDIPMADF
ncbi:hypothetical protein [Halotia branconii]|uniref:Uncharacterized protein n=1 Tax=Halotia branconii CENA392 TaxID=1539056 RepID=A0AAJ6PA13_9CYAN|nr:hypothetical protein [Halotia branconii]WGV26262.1 hypothetical protein QI031_01740 [Halotia branconii CENA392]